MSKTLSPRAREILDAALFLPAVAGLALVVFAAMWLVIAFGGFVVQAWYRLLHDFIPLPHALALALTVLQSALTVYGLAWWLGRRSWTHRRR